MDTTPPTQLAPLRRAINALVNAGRDLHARLVAAIAATDTSYLPRRLRANPVSAEARVTTTLDWIVALARTLAGDPFFLPLYRLPAYPRLPATYPALTNAIRASCGLPLNPPATPAERAASHLRYIRRVFATQATGVIAARLARRLAIAPGTDAWPSELIALNQTPAALCRARPLAPTPPPVQEGPCPPNPTPPPAASSPSISPPSSPTGEPSPPATRPPPPPW